MDEADADWSWKEEDRYSSLANQVIYFSTSLLCSHRRCENENHVILISITPFSLTGWL